MTYFDWIRPLVRVATLGLAAVALAHAGPGDWNGQGPFGGFVVGVKADPLVPSRFYAMTQNGFFRSDDSGSSWTLAEAGLLTAHPTNGVFAVSPTTAGVVYLFDDTGRLYSTGDAGNTWTATGYSLGTQLATYQQNVALAVGAGSSVWLAAGTSGLFVSANSGISFSAASGTGYPVGAEVDIVATNPGATQNVIVGVGGTSCNATTGACPVYTSSNGGTTWTSVTVSDGMTISAGTNRRPSTIAFGPGSAVYAIYGDPGYRSGVLIASSNNGSSWASHALPVDAFATWLNDPIVPLAVAPADANTVWVRGYVSTTGGSSFSPISSTGRTTNGVLVPSITAVAPAANYATSGRISIGTSAGGMFLSNDHGNTWAATDDGMTATEIRAVVVHPIDNTRLFAAFGDSTDDPSEAFYRSTSSGTWTVSNTGMNAYQLRSIALDPTTASTVGSTVIYAAGSGADTVPAFSAGDHRNSGIYKSIDGGLTWTNETGIPTANHFPGDLRTIIIDPRSCDARASTASLCTSGPLQTLFVTGAGRPTGLAGSGNHPLRVMKSTDGGVNWSDSSVGLPDDIIGAGCIVDFVGGVTPIVMDPTDSNVLYLGTFPDATDADCNEVTPHVASGVYKSTNGGASWFQISTGLPTYSGSVTVLDTLSLAIDPSNPSTLWVSTKNFDTDPQAPGEIYKTVDGGMSWSVSNAGINGPDIRALLVDPTSTGTIYAASAGTGPANPGGVYKSTDAGATWMSISAGFPATAATALALDPIDPTVLYAGTNGGVYTMVQLPDEDADGVPDLVENSGPNGGDANHDSSQDSAQTNVGTTAPGLFGGWQAGILNASRSARTAQLQQQLQAMKTAQAQGGVQGGYFTVQVDNGACPQAVDVTADNPGPLGLDTVPHHGTYTYPRGLVHFEIPGCSTTPVDVMFNAATFGPGWTWRYYGPSTPGDNSTMGWHDATSLVTSQIGNDWKINLVNGGFGSYRPAVVHSILFKGGPAYNEEIFSDNLEQ